MTLKEYRLEKGITQAALAKELKEISPGIDVPLISKMEQGLCRPCEEVQAYIDSSIIAMPELTTFQKRIISYIQYQTECRGYAEREDLCSFFDIKDRELRKEIEALRRLGIRILSCSGKKGYWMSTGEADYKKYRAEVLSRIHAQLSTLGAMDRHTEGQLDLRYWKC